MNFHRFPEFMNLSFYKLTKITLRNENEGEIILENPFGNADFSYDKEYEKEDQWINIKLAEGEKATVVT